jgi:alpha,alpha-trehalase
MPRAALRLLAVTLLALASGATEVRAQAAQESIDTYIHQGWDKLARSTSDCASLVDPKVHTVPVLYLAANENMPKAVTEMRRQCKVDVRRLPRMIHSEGDVLPADLPVQGLLYLPNRYVVPGGRFNEMYGWDSYFILLGEIADGRVALARDTVENFFYEIDFYGAILNANRTYYLTRSQPPFLSSMVLAVYRAMMKTDAVQARKFLRKSLPYLRRDHKLWTTAPHLAADTGLSRYFGLGSGPVPEMEDDRSYYVTVLQWLIAHPTETPTGYLEAAKSCVGACALPVVDGQTLTAGFYQNDRAMRESGFDTSFRFGPFSGSTTEFAPFGLNALLFKYERDVAFVEATLGDTDAAVDWSSAAGVRLATVQELMWDDKAGLFMDYSLRTKQTSTYAFLTTYYALWAGIATPVQGKRLVGALPLFERPGGLQTSTVRSGEQWDAPYGWAPLNWLAVEGLERYGFHDVAVRVAKEFMTTVAANYGRDGTIREKYDVENSSANVAVDAGYKENVIGFGWTNAVYAKLEQFLAK